MGNMITQTSCRKKHTDFVKISELINDPRN